MRFSAGMRDQRGASLGAFYKKRPQHGAVSKFINVIGAAENLCRIEQRNGATYDRLERSQAVAVRGRAQAMIREQRCEIAFIAMQRHVIEDYGVDEKVDIIRHRGRSALH